MAFQSYCWNLGTTSFRVQNLNYKIERQLQMLNELWSDRSNITWDGITQEKYYNIMHKEGFVTAKGGQFKASQVSILLKRYSLNRERE